MGNVRLRLCGGWQWVVSQDMRVGVPTLHGVWLIGRRFMVQLIILVVKAAVPFSRAPSATCVSPAGWWWVVTLAGGAMVSHRQAGGGRALDLRGLWRKVARGGGSALGPSRRRRHGLPDYRGVCDVGPRSGRRLRQLSAAPPRRTGPRGGGDGTPADRTTALHEK